MMNSLKPRRPRSNRLPTHTFERPRCPECGNARLKKFRSIRDQGDGSALWWVVCANKSCAHRFRVVLE